MDAFLQITQRRLSLQKKKLKLEILKETRKLNFLGRHFDRIQNIHKWDFMGH